MFLNYYTSKILIFTFLQMCQNAQLHNKLKTEARYENRTINLVLKSYQTFADIFDLIMEPSDEYQDHHPDLEA